MAIKMFIKNTIQKEWRSKTLLFLLVLTTIMVVLASLGLGYFKDHVLTASPLEGLAKTSLSVFFGGINLWSYLIATFIGLSCVRSDLESGAINQMLTFPVSRFEYFLGRLIGAYAIVTGYYLLSMVICIVGVSMAIGELLLSPELFVGIFIVSLSNLVVITSAMFIGLYMGTLQTFILNILMTFVVTFSNSYYLEKGISAGLENFGFLKLIALFFHLFIPHFPHWENWGSSFILGDDFKFDWMMETPHFIVTYALMALCFTFLFKKKQL